MPKSKPLSDAFYDEQVDRMQGLAKFPLVPAAQKELRRALRRASETDASFVQRVITEIVDNQTVCPTPRDLIKHIGAMRDAEHKPMAFADCPHCHGTGFVTTTRLVHLSGLAPYEAEVAARCTCSSSPGNNQG